MVCQGPAQEMKIIRTAETMRAFVESVKVEGKILGYTPTMGALHEGHFSLMRKSLAQNDVSVSSIFVNPTQFNDQGDLLLYPRREEADCQVLEKMGCDAVFIPAVDEIYPKGRPSSPPLDLNGLDTVLEGAFRPGHFAGVAQVVRRLLEIIPCNALYMGQKDWQQTAVIAHMLSIERLDIRLIRCPTIRDTDGLALSSRNSRLTTVYRQKAPVIYRVLRQAKKWVGTKSPRQVSALGMEYIDGAGLRPEYFQVVDGMTLRPVEDWTAAELVVACTAVWAGDVRLIDNLILVGEL